MSLTAGGLVAVGLTGSAEAAVTGPINCPKALPTADAVDGLDGTGFTVEKGTDPDPFSAHVLGRLKNGIAPGIDMIMAEISSPAVDRAGDIWAGMSGSPVYTSDGRLIGSVSYALGINTHIAGLTPGPDIVKLYDTKSAKSTTPPKPATKITVPGAAGRKLLANGATKAAVSKGFSKLKVPVTVSGVPARGSKVLSRLSKALKVPVRASGATAEPGKAGSDEIFAASNFVDAYSYGDISVGATGTTTTVCDGRAIAFGHPFDNWGKVNQAALSAEAVLIQPSVDGASKIANFGGLAGTVDRDLQTGVRANLGVDPTTYPITTSISADGGAAVTSKSYGVDQDVAAPLGELALETAITGAAGHDGPGTGKFSFTISGTRTGGKAFTLKKTDYYSDKASLSATAGFSLYDTLDSLTDQAFEPVKITKIDITGTTTDVFKEWRVNNVLVKKGGTYVRGLSRTVKAGKSVQLRASLSPYQSEKVSYLYYTVPVPKSASGGDGTLAVTAGGDDGGIFLFSASAKAVSKKPKNKFDDLLKKLGTPSGDALTASLDLRPTVATKIVVVKTVNAPIASYEKDYTVTVR